MYQQNYGGALGGVPGTAPPPAGYSDACGGPCGSCCGSPCMPGMETAGALAGFSPQELDYYQTLFSYVDQENKLLIDRMTAANFLYTSGLPQNTLKALWQIADDAGQGYLTRDRFFVALRLVAHAQAGHHLTPELQQMPPPRLPDFQGVQRRREPSETSPAPGSQVGATSDISELQPVIGSSEAFMTRKSGPPSPRGPRWLPSQREKRKYASLFKRTDLDGDGYVQGFEAKTLLLRSGLESGQLSLAWEHADADRDGKLNFREFVVLIHLVSCAVKGLPVPGLQDGLPMELNSSLINLESPEVLVVQREASRSRSPSPAISGQQSPSFLNTPATQTAVSRGRSPAQASAMPSGSPQIDPATWAQPSTGPAAGDFGDFANMATTDPFETNPSPAVFPSSNEWGDQSQQPATGGDQTGVGDSAGWGGDWGGDAGGNVGGFEFSPPPDAGDGGKKKKKKKDKSRDPPDIGGATVGFDAAEDGGIGAGWQMVDAPGVASSVKGASSAAGSPGHGRSPSASSRERTAVLQDYGDVGSSYDSSTRRQRSRDYADNFAERRERERREERERQEEERERERERLDRDRRDEELARERRSQEASRQEQLQTVVVQFEAVIAADRAVSRQLRREVDDLEQELRQIREARDQLERHVEHETRDGDRFVEHRRELERQMEDARRRLGDLREDRRAENLESISLRRDREHFADELAFLRRTFEDEELTTEVLRRANTFLEKSYRDLELHTEQLERQRKELLAQVQQEGDLVRQEERHNAEMRNHLERLRREQNIDLETRREANLREVAIREMQSDGPQVPAFVPAAVAPDTHTWAQRVVPKPTANHSAGIAQSPLAAGGLGISAAAAPSAGRSMMPVPSPILPGLGREGV